MTPSQIIALVRDTALVVGVGLILLFVYRSGEDRLKAADLKDLQADIQQQAKTLQTWRQESTYAQKQLSLDLAAIHTAPVVVHDWSLREPSCAQPAMLPAAADKTGSQPTVTGPVQPGIRTDAESDRRDSIVADFKQRWELILANCRSLDAQWPQP